MPTTAILYYEVPKPAEYAALFGVAVFAAVVVRHRCAKKMR